MKEALWEAVKEPLRLLVLAIIPFGISYFTEVGTEWAIGAVVILRFIDKWLHEYAVAKAKKDRNEGWLGVKGLTAF